MKNLKEYILLYEQDENPHYDINPDIKVNGESGSPNGSNKVSYKVEYISKIDPKWRNWYSKDESIDKILKVIPKMRDDKINKILN